MLAAGGEVSVWKERDRDHGQKRSAICSGACCVRQNREASKAAKQQQCPTNLGGWGMRLMSRLKQRAKLFILDVWTRTVETRLHLISSTG